MIRYGDLAHFGHFGDINNLRESDPALRDFQTKIRRPGDNALIAMNAYETIKVFETSGSMVMPIAGSLIRMVRLEKVFRIIMAD